ncbi:hypothetical protein [Agromyces bauzanensis]
MTQIEPSPEEYADLGRLLVARAIRQDHVTSIRRRIVVGTAGGILLVGAMGAAWVALANPALRTNAAYCHAEADPSSSFVGVGAPAAEAHDGTLLQRGVDPIELCAAVWSIGAVGPHATEPPVDGVTYGVPDLTACIRLDGIVAVFPNEERRPGEELCRELGLAPWHD